MRYDDFLASKEDRFMPRGASIDMTPAELHDALYPFQKDVVSRALSVGRSALFEDCGLGKTIQSLEWARHVHEDTGKPVLFFTPLAVGHQVVAESEKIGIDARLARSQNGVSGAPIAVTNYEMMHHFDATQFGGLVLDESGILKNDKGATRNALVDFARAIPFRLAATATPAPNDLMELLNHAAYFGIMSVKEALSLWFVNDQASVHTWRLKGHAEGDFWKWVGKWAIAIRKPSDLGYEDGSFELPPFTEIDQVISSEFDGDTLFPVAPGITETRRIRRNSILDRARQCADMVNASDEPWVIWCELNDESAALKAMIPHAVEVRGSDKTEVKTERLVGFTTGKYRVIVTKPSIAGHGLNWQHCARTAFVGIGWSYEQYYQAVRRIWRYGQKRPVEVHRFMTEHDRHIAATLKRKEETTMTLFDKIPWQMDEKAAPQHVLKSGDTIVESEDEWTLYQGDSVIEIDNVESESIGLSVFSPPFPGMYVYTDSPSDMGNVATISEMIEQFSYLVAPDKLMRVMMPGRSVFMHITQGVAQKGRDGYIGLKDFRGSLIGLMQMHGWIYYGEVTIDKNPQVKAVRTKDHGLMFKSLANDAAAMHPAMSDMLLQFRKPGDNPAPIRAGQSQKYGNMAGWVTSEDWILWARPVWYAQDYRPVGVTEIPGIQETDVLNVQQARSGKDERHIAPLQLGVIDRCVQVWSALGETVFSPFAGVGSEGVVAVRAGRKFVGCELKPEYWHTACNNLRTLTKQTAWDF